MEQEFKKKLEQAKKYNKTQVVAAGSLFLVASINLYFGRVDIVFWQFLLGVYCLLFYRVNVRVHKLFGEYFESLERNLFYCDYNELLQYKIDMLIGKMSKEEFEKKVFEFSDKYKLWNETDCVDCADLSACGGVQ